MKLAKLSLAAIVALGVSAFADVQNIKVSGDAKLFYATFDNDNDIPDASFFNKKSSAGQAALDLALSADLAESVKGKLSVTALSTLGLENNLVSYIWAGTTTDTVWWVNEAWLAKSFGNTTVKVGRQELDTPLAFSEKWNIAANSFDAAVVLNNDLPQTTLVAAWVGKGNGLNSGVVRTKDSNGNTSGDFFRTYGSEIVDLYGLDANKVDGGAYAFAAVTKLIPNTTAQVWFYNVTDIANAWWLQADVSLAQLLPGLSFGAQYAMIDPQGQISSVDESKAWAVKLGYATGALKLSAAYSKTDDDGVVAIANTATGAAKGSQSKLYTEAWWNYGYVGMPATDAWNISAEYSMEGVADFGAYYTATSYDSAAAKNGAVLSAVYGTPWNSDVDMKEFALTASKSFGSLDATLAYIYTDADDQNIDTATGKADSYNMLQVYLTYNF